MEWNINEFKSAIQFKVKYVFSFKCSGDKLGAGDIRSQLLESEYWTKLCYTKNVSVALPQTKMIAHSSSDCFNLQIGLK